MTLEPLGPLWGRGVGFGGVGPKAKIMTEARPRKVAKKCHFLQSRLRIRLHIHHFSPLRAAHHSPYFSVGTQLFDSKPNDRSKPWRVLLAQSIRVNTGLARHNDCRAPFRFVSRIAKTATESNPLPPPRIDGPLQVSASGSPRVSFVKLAPPRVF